MCISAILWVIILCYITHSFARVVPVLAIGIMFSLSSVSRDSIPSFCFFKNFKICFKLNLG